MKISEISLDDILKQVRIEKDYMEDGDEAYLNALLAAAIEYVKSYTGLDDDEIDEHEDLTIAVLVLISDMYDNRMMEVDYSNVNQTVETILGFHRTNLL